MHARMPDTDGGSWNLARAVPQPGFTHKRAQGGPKQKKTRGAYLWVGRVDFGQGEGSRSLLGTPAKRDVYQLTDGR